MPLAYSYLRFSSPQQAEGDSLRRQTENREKWLADHPGIPLDTSLVLEDRGRSAFKRQNWDTYALAEFLRHVESGRVEAGSYLLVENLDRLSREDAGEGTELFLSIVNRGIVIVQLSPAVMEFARPVNMMQLMFAIVELSRGHSESAIKSERCRKAWERKNREAASRVVTKRLPGWIKRAEDGRLVLDQAAAKTVRRAFDMARDGHSVVSIARVFNAEKVPVIGRKVMTKRGDRRKPEAERERKPVLWAATTLYGILTSRAAIGEYMPYQSTRRPDKPKSDPVPGYYPAAVDEETFNAVRAALAMRASVGRGRRGKHVNLFAGLLKEARDGGTISYSHRRDSCELVPVSAKQGSGQVWVSFPAADFERAILSRLREVRASDFPGDGRRDAKRKVEAIAGEHADAEQKVKWYQARSDEAKTKEDFDLSFNKASEWQRKAKTLAAELARAQGEAASPLAESWGEFRSLAELLDKDKSDELRLRVRAALRRAVDGIYCLFVGHRQMKFAVAQVWFNGGSCHRDYLLVYTPGRSNGSVKRPGECKSRPLPPSESLARKAQETLAEWTARLETSPAAKADEHDLRNPRSAATLEKKLQKLLPAIGAGK